MANPMENEDKLYEKIKKEKIRVHPIVWELIEHHVPNDLSRVSMSLGMLRFTPKWILKAASFIINFLYKLSRQPGTPPEGLIEMCNKNLDRIKSVDKFLRNLKKVTDEKLVK